MTAEQLELPVGVVTRADVGRLTREAEALDNTLNQATIRGATPQLPKTSQLLEECATSNKLNLLQAADRQKLLGFLETVHLKAPVLHMSFNADPSPTFQQGLITWIRQQLHPMMLLQIGLRPSIGAGCIVRTSNKYFDFSLRQRFADQRMLLISKLQGGEAPAAAAASEPNAEAAGADA